MDSGYQNDAASSAKMKSGSCGADHKVQESSCGAGSKAAATGRCGAEYKVKDGACGPVPTADTDSKAADASGGGSK